MSYLNILEEELKNKIAQDYFWQFDCTKIIGKLDFCVTFHSSNHNSKNEMFEQESLLWAEAKKGVSDIYTSLVQLILTIGKARTFDKSLPPAFLGAIDAVKIAFVPYNEINEIFYVNDFNWNVTPSNHNTKEFKLIHDKVKSIIEKNALLFEYDKDEKELHKFIKTNFVVGKYGVSKIRIDKNNFMVVYNKWLTAVKPTIAANWDLSKKHNIIDGDFYLADLLSHENSTLKDKLFVLLKKDHYEFDRKLSDTGFFTQSQTGFTDNQIAHTQFWNKYERPPKEEYWEYIVSRRDLLVPQDVRERKGSFFTPQIWVELSQKYIAEVLGEDWQDEYYIWDCAAGTGNLLNGLTNKRNIWASTLDTQDVEVMKDRIKNGANLFEDHVFQFDFLNDEFTKLPKALQEIINDPEKRKKLVIYINPPYAEAGDAKQRTGTGKNKSKTTTDNKTYHKYKNELGKASNELYTQFLIRIKNEISNCWIANFSTMKLLTSSNFRVFRNNFQVKPLKSFIVNANTFDNVKGNFPIGFLIWNTDIKKNFNKIKVDVFDERQNLIKRKTFYSFDDTKGKINDWFRSYRYKTTENIGFLMADAPDFQNNNLVAILNYKGTRHGIFSILSRYNLIPASIYLAVRHCIDGNWINDRDQYLIPNKKWEKDIEFQNNCFTFALFHSQNKIKNTVFLNHWIPFTEDEVGCNKAFESNFMTQFIKGKLKKEQTNLFDSPPSEGWQSKTNGVVSSSMKLKRNTKTILELPYNSNLKERAKELRKAGNLSEVLLWNEIKNGKFKGLDFDRQRIIGNYIVDFYTPNCNTVIEIDGSSHNEKIEYDLERDKYLNSLGLEVIHLNDLDIKNNLSFVMEYLHNHEAFKIDLNKISYKETIQGKHYNHINKNEETTLSAKADTPPMEGNFSVNYSGTTPLEFSEEAKAVFDAGRELWRYYHKQPNINVNASLYDIREHFQGRNEKGTMNKTSNDEIYNQLIGDLRDRLKDLAKKIEPKVYEYGFLKE